MSRIENALKKALEHGGKMDPEKAPAAGPPLRTAVPAEVVELSAITSPYLPALCDPACPVSEEYKKLKSNIVNWTKQDRFKNTILITSAIGGEGKSITAANLAISLSHDFDHSVLLIDADLRKPTLHTYFGLQPKRGLSDCLAEDTDISSALIRIGSEHLTFLPSGARSDNPVELLSSRRMQKLINDMKHRYPDRFIIIDAPPVLLFAEAKVISSLVDGIVFVVKEETASLQNVTDALNSVRDSAVVGIVYNNVSLDNLDNYYHYRQYDRYSAAPRNA